MFNIQADSGTIDWLVLMSIPVFSQGMGGVIAACANILCIMLSPGPVESGFGFFLTAELVVVLALIGYLCLPILVGYTALNCYHDYSFISSRDPFLVVV